MLLADARLHGETMRTDVIVISRRDGVRRELGLRLGLPAAIVTGRSWELSEIYVSSALPPKVAIIDVQMLFPIPDPAVAPPPPDARLGLTAFMVVGFQADSDALLAALKEGIPIHLLEKVTREDLVQAVNVPRRASTLHVGMGRLSEERVLSYLHRSYAERTLARREAEVSERARTGYGNRRGTTVLGSGEVFGYYRERYGTRRPLLHRKADGYSDGLTPETRLRLMGLSRREAEVAVLGARGFLVREIAQQLQIAPGTVMTLVARAREKLGCGSMRELAVTLFRMRVLQITHLGGPVDQSDERTQLQ